MKLKFKLLILILAFGVVANAHAQQDITLDFSDCESITAGDSCELTFSPPDGTQFLNQSAYLVFADEGAITPAPGNNSWIGLTLTDPNDLLSHDDVLAIDAQEQDPTTRSGNRRIIFTSNGPLPHYAYYRLTAIAGNSNQPVTVQIQFTGTFITAVRDVNGAELSEFEIVVAAPPSRSSGGGGGGGGSSNTGTLLALAAVGGAIYYYRWYKPNAAFQPFALPLGEDAYVAGFDVKTGESSKLQFTYGERDLDGFLPRTDARLRWEYRF